MRFRSSPCSPARCSSNGRSAEASASAPVAPEPPAAQGGATGAARCACRAATPARVRGTDCTRQAGRSRAGFPRSGSTRCRRRGDWPAAAAWTRAPGRSTRLDEVRSDLHEPRSRRCLAPAPTQKTYSPEVVHSPAAKPRCIRRVRRLRSPGAIPARGPPTMLAPSFPPICRNRRMVLPQTDAALRKLCGDFPEFAATLRRRKDEELFHFEINCLPSEAPRRPAHPRASRSRCRPPPIARARRKPPRCAC